MALRDTADLFQVERVSSFKGNISGPKSQLYFKVHWLGYDETSWEPWANVRANIKLHEFIRNHTNKSVRNLLPQQFNAIAEIPNDSESEDDFEQ